MAEAPFSLLSVAVSSSTSPFFRRSTRRFIPGVRACQPLHNCSKFYNEFGRFDLKRKIEDLVLRAEMLTPAALEHQESIRLKQEEYFRECNVWDDLAKTSEMFVELGESSKAVDVLRDLIYKLREAKLVTELAEIDAINFEVLKQAYAASVNVNRILDKYEISKLRREPYDIEGACVTVQSRHGGNYSEIWLEQLTQMYMKWAEKQGHTGRITDKQISENGGIISATMEFEFKFAYGCLSGERGTHNMVRVTQNEFSPTEVGTAAIDVIPLFLESSPDLSITDNDIVITQLSSCEEEHYKPNPSAYIQHISSGVGAYSKGERSGFANKLKALNRLKAKLLIILREQGVSNLASIDRNAIPNIWTQETRRYVLHLNKLVHDLKTGFKMADLDSILNGNIEPFIGAHISTRRASSTI